MLNFRTASAFLFFLVATLPLQAQVESDFYNPDPVVSNLQLQVNASDYEGDDTQALQTLIDQATLLSDGVKRGANIFIPAGRYYISTITMKSNVHLKVNSDTTFRLISHPNPDKIHKMFVFGGKNEPHVTNTSIVCQTSSDERFHITLTDTTNSGIMPISFGNASNFKLSGIRIIDDRTRYQGINFSTTTDPNGNYVRPMDGYIRNVSIKNAAYGYGLVQMHSGKNICFNNISGVGGTTLRLESGWLEDEAPDLVMEDIFARNVRCTDGNSAVMLSPHQQNHKTVDIRNVTANSCGFAVRISDSFPPGGLPNGSFARDSVIRQVKVKFGNNALVRAIHFKFAPPSFKYTVFKNDKLDNEPEAYRGPSISASLLTACFTVDFNPNQHISSLTTDGKNRPNGGKFVSAAIDCPN